MISSTESCSLCFHGIDHINTYFCNDKERYRKELDEVGPKRECIRNSVKVIRYSIRDNVLILYNGIERRRLNVRSFRFIQYRGVTGLRGFFHVQGRLKKNYLLRWWESNKVTRQYRTQISTADLDGGEY